MSPLRALLTAAGLVLAAVGSGSLRGATSRNCTGGCEPAPRKSSSGSGAASVAPRQHSRVGLSPPWWITYDWLVATIGAAPDAKVGTLEQGPDGSGFEVNVSSNDSVVARGLDLLLRESVGRVNVTVVGPIANGSEYESAIGHALAANPYFSTAQIHRRGSWMRPVLSVTVLPSVIQIFSDNLASPWGLTSLTAEDAFGQVLNDKLPSSQGLIVSTSPKGLSNQRPTSHTKPDTDSRHNASVPNDLSASAAVGLSPPWWITHKWLTATIGATPNVKVGPLKRLSGRSGFQVSVFSPDSVMARGLDLLLRKMVGRVNVSVVGPLGNASDHDSIHQALEGNPYYHKAAVHQRGFGLPPVFAVIMLPSVVQIHSDNLASPWGLTTHVAAEAFGQLFNEALPSGEELLVTTLPKELV